MRNHAHLLDLSNADELAWYLDNLAERRAIRRYERFRSLIVLVLLFTNVGTLVAWGMS
jgi:hypothetical protein